MSIPVKKSYVYFVSFMNKKYGRRKTKVEGPYNRVITVPTKVTTRDQIRNIEKDIFDSDMSNTINDCIVLTNITLLSEPEKIENE